MRRLSIILLIVLVGHFGPRRVDAQSLSDLPANVQNSRFFADLSASGRPSLSLNGFSCGSTCGDGLGLLEVVDAVYGRPQSQVVPVYARLQELASETILSGPLDRTGIIDNSRRLQAQALLAVVAYVGQQNGWTEGRPAGYGGDLDPLPDPREFTQTLRDVIEDPERILPGKRLTDDAVKWASTVGNLARTLDLYLALENAVLFFADPDPPLLDCSEKAALLNIFGQAVRTVDDLGNLPILAGIRRDEAQAGNWPMKVHIAVGLASLSAQTPEDDILPDGCVAPEDYPWEHWLERGLRSAGAPTNRNRSKHWHYQTASGQPLFAEGPYYLQWALNEVIPFWHAVRLNGLLGRHPDFDLEDPFHSDWFTGPLGWLADLATPEGSTPPLDDGNRAPMDNSVLMRWTPEYGDRATGLKFAWLADRPGLGFASDDDLLPVELAMPRQPEGSGSPPRPGLSALGPTDEPQQFVVRHQTAAGENHYVLLNGERGDAISRGEGHEQPDQLQLLYYVDGDSYLMDSGYDDAVGLANSSWNHYFDHNVLGIQGSQEGGVLAPIVDLFSSRIRADHQDVSDFEATARGHLTGLTGRMPLFEAPSITGSVSARYRRDILMVGDQEAPYLIDVNAATAGRDSLRFLQRYHGGSADATILRDDAAGSSVVWRAIGDAGGTLVAQILAPENISLSLHSDVARERFELDQMVARLDLESSAVRANETFRSVAVLQVRPGPRDADGIRFERAGDGVWIRRFGDERVDILVVAPGVDIWYASMDEFTFGLSRTLDAPIGFLRLTRDFSGWRTDPEFAFGLELKGVSTRSAPSEFPESEALRIAPNPFRDRIAITSPEDGAVIEVYDLLGRKVFSGLSSGAMITLDSSGWAPGIYVVRSSIQGRIVGSVAVIRAADR